MKHTLLYLTIISAFFTLSCCSSDDDSDLDNNPGPIKETLTIPYTLTYVYSYGDIDFTQISGTEFTHIKMEGFNFSPYSMQNGFADTAFNISVNSADDSIFNFEMKSISYLDSNYTLKVYVNDTFLTTNDFGNFHGGRLIKSKFCPHKNDTCVVSGSVKAKWIK